MPRLSAVSLCSLLSLCLSVSQHSRSLASPLLLLRERRRTAVSPAQPASCFPLLSSTRDHFPPFPLSFPLPFSPSPCSTRYLSLVLTLPRPPPCPARRGTTRGGGPRRRSGGGGGRRRSASRPRRRPRRSDGGALRKRRQRPPAGRCGKNGVIDAQRAGRMRVCRRRRERGKKRKEERRRERRDKVHASPSLRFSALP